MDQKEYIKYLESKIPKGVDINEKYFKEFQKQAGYLGNGIYNWGELKSTDTRELFLMGCLIREKIVFKKY